MRSLVCALFATSIASAQPAPDADALFKRGRELLAAGKIGEACDAFAKSDAADPVPATKLALGVCREKNHQLASAWRLYTEVVRELLAKTDPGSAQLARVAATNASKLEPRLSKLTIEVAQRIPGLEIRIGTETVDIAQWGHAAPSDGGTFVVSASAAGRDPWSTKITVGAERDAQTVHVPELAAHPVARTEPAHGAVEAARPALVTAPPTASHTAPIALGIGAVILAGGAVALEVVGSRTYDKSKAEPDVDHQLSLWHTANTERYAAEAFGIAAIACAGTAVWLYVRHRDERAPRTALVPTGTGIALTGSF